MSCFDVLQGFPDFAHPTERGRKIDEREKERERDREFFFLFALPQPRFAPQVQSRFSSPPSPPGPKTSRPRPSRTHKFCHPRTRLAAHVAAPLREKERERERSRKRERERERERETARVDCRKRDMR